MPYRVEKAEETGGFDVIYHLECVDDGAVVDWSDSRQEAELKAAKLNRVATRVQAIICPLVYQLSVELNEQPEAILREAVTQAVTKTKYAN